MKLTNPFPKGDIKNRIIFTPSEEIFLYFFKGCLAGDWGARSALCNTFMQRLHAACVADGILPAYDPNNEHRIATILDRLNFDDTTARVAELERELADLRQQLTPRGATPRLPERKTKSGTRRRNVKGKDDPSGSGTPSNGAVPGNTGS